MVTSRRGAATLMLGLSATMAGCGLAMRPVRFEATEASWQALAGEWRGQYWLRAYDRHGLIAFRLAPSPEGASGDVLMIADRAGWPYQRYPMDAGMRPEPYNRTELLAIRFVRADAGHIAGQIDPYWDPDRRCDAVASFRGAVEGDVIHGTVSSTCVAESWRVVSGRWRVERKRVTEAH